ncbi:MAG: hypothetical protein KF741_10695 [Ferruginibacter sp.]|nr:hypothetical protein [Bacteroidota bacterium]MBX2919698.1 hypothetical protein [Ferruginibacter sp.]MCC7379650.1 hypothetical protein [Chitinophagaceae bacterium]
MKFFFISLLLCISVRVFSQQSNYLADRIYLNDSVTVYDGLIIEQAPAKYVIIVRQKEKDTIQVLMKDIWKMLRIYPVQDTVQKKPEPYKSTKVTKSKFFFVELLGSGGVYSINYDFRFDKSISNKWGLRTGIEFLPIKTVNFSGDELTYRSVLFPFMLNYLVGKKNKFLELGLGAVYVFKQRNGELLAQEHEYFIQNINRRIPNVYGAISVGFRRNPIKGKIMWGVSITPLVGNSFIVPNIGFKIGYRA